MSLEDRIKSPFSCESRLFNQNNNQICLLDNSIRYPFQIDYDLIEKINCLCRYEKKNSAKAKKIFEWMLDNISYSKDLAKYKNSKEVFESGKGICGEMSFLYITMLRSLDIKSNYVRVTIDSEGKDVRHGCAVAELEYGRVFVDIAYKKFGIKHREYEILSDVDIMLNYLYWQNSEKFQNIFKIYT